MQWVFPAQRFLKASPQKIEVLWKKQNRLGRVRGHFSNDFIKHITIFIYVTDEETEA